MAVANEVNVRELRRIQPDNPALKKYASLGKIFSGAEGRDDDFYISGFIDYLHMLTEQLMLPGLRKFGMRSEVVTDICRQADTKNNPVNLPAELLSEIIARRI
jgi:alcohol dehydrogenase class IV